MDFIDYMMDVLIHSIHQLKSVSDSMLVIGVFVLYLMSIYVSFQFGQKSIQQQVIFDRKMRTQFENVQKSKLQLDKSILSYQNLKYSSGNILALHLAVLIGTFVYSNNYQFELYDHVCVLFSSLLAFFLFIWLALNRKIRILGQQKIKIELGKTEFIKNLLEDMGPILRQVLEFELKTVNDLKEKQILCDQQNIQVQQLEIQRYEKFMHDVLAFQGWCDEFCYKKLVQEVIIFTKTYKLNIYQQKTIEQSCKQNCLQNYFEEMQKIGIQFKTKENEIKIQKQKFQSLKSQLLYIEQQQKNKK